VFEEIPNQLEEYFAMKSIIPNDRTINNQEDLKRRNSLNTKKVLKSKLNLKCTPE
jgi:hypothetical protein